MKKCLLPLLVFVLSVSAQVQPVQREIGVSAFAGMGVNFVSAGDMVEYINSTSTFAQRVDDFGIAVDFFGGVGFPLNEEWGIKIEHTYLFKSYAFMATNGAAHDLFYAVHAPSLIVQRIFAGKGYFVTFGAGGGYHFGNASQKISTYGNETDYSAQGVGIKAEVVGETAFDEHLYGYIGGQIAFEFLGELKDGGGVVLANTVRKQKAGLNLYSAGIRFGIIYYL